MSASSTPMPGAGERVRGSAAVADGSESTATKSPTDPGPAVELWNVGGLDPRFVKVLTVLGFAIPTIAYVVLVLHYQVNVVVADQWDNVPVIRQSYVHILDWSSLWSQHNDNRMLFPNLIAVMLAHTVHFNIEIEEDLSALILVAATAVLIWTHKRRSPATPLLFYCPVAFLMLTFAQWGNALFGFQIAWFLCLFAVVLVIALLDRPVLTRPTLVAAALLAVVASYTLVQGLLIWPVGLLLLYVRRRPRWTLFAWVAAAVLTAALYFYNLTPANDSPRAVLEHPYLSVKFFLFALGDIVGMQMKFGAPANAGVMAFGVLIFVLAIWVLIKWGLRRDESGAAVVGVAVIVYGFLFDALITNGRVIFGVWGATQSRYTTDTVLVLVGVYLAVVGSSASPAKSTSAVVESGRSKTRSQPMARLTFPVQRINGGVVRRIVLAVIVIQVLISVHYGLIHSRELHKQNLAAASLTRNIHHESEVAVKVGLYYFRTSTWIRSQAQFLEDHHLGPYG